MFFHSISWLNICIIWDLCKREGFKIVMLCAWLITRHHQRCQLRVSSTQVSCSCRLRFDLERRYIHFTTWTSFALPTLIPPVAYRLRYQQHCSNRLSWVRTCKKSSLFWDDWAAFSSQCFHCPIPKTILRWLWKLSTRRWDRWKRLSLFGPQWAACEALLTCPGCFGFCYGFLAVE